jgi:ubiquinone/menaquinone biosynthesis C-methylase UbiE
MAKSELIARQSAHPTGLLGHVVARVMALDTARVNRDVLRALEPKPGERVLELGCGHGRTLRRVARAVGSGGMAVGVDPSDVMVRVARRHNRREIAAGSARVEPGNSTCIPEPDASFYKLFSVHTLYFWPYLDAGLRELRRVLRPGGTLLLALHSGENAEIATKLPDSVYTLRSDDDMTGALRRADFVDIALTIDPGTQLRIVRAHA